MKETLGGYPFNLKKTSNQTTIEFLPKSESAKNADFVRFRLNLSKSDLKTLEKIIRDSK